MLILTLFIVHHAIPTMIGLSTIDFQNNQPIAHEYNYYKYILWALNLLWNLITYM